MRPPRRLLATTDFTTESRVGVRVARRLAARFGAELWVATVRQEDDRTPEEDLRERVLEAADRVLAEGPDVEIHPAVLAGPVAAGISTFAFERQIDLLVLATHGKTGVDRLLTGSTAQRLIRVSPCSVLAVRPEFDGWFDAILVAMDYSVQAAAAAKCAIQFARSLGIPEVTLGRAQSRSNRLFPKPSTQVVLPEGISGPVDEAEVMRVLREQAGDDVTLVQQTLEGEPQEAILHAGRSLREKGRTPLVLMGTRGRTKASNVLLGSVTEHVLRNAPFSVLADKPKTISLDYFQTVLNLANR